MPKVSVIMPAYNSGKYIKESIESVFTQSYTDLELIVVDGGSNDATDEICAGYKKDPRFIYVKKPGSGISAARNYGIKTAKGALIAFLDADDLFCKDKVKKQVAFFEKNKDCNVLYANKIYFNSDTTKEVLSTYHNFSGDIFYFLKRNNFIHPSALMASREIFEKNLYNENIPSHEDWELFLRLAKEGICFSYMKEPLTKIRVRITGATGNKNVFDKSRQKVGMLARQYWKEFKREMNLKSSKGQKAILRYLKFKLVAFLIGFPNGACFNRTPAQDLL